MKKIIIESKKHGTFEVLVDDEDFEWLTQIKWSIIKAFNCYYATNHIRGAKTLIMHREIMKRHNFDITSMQIDHIDHNGINNQKENLRICTNAENNRNKPIKTEFRGVVKNTSGKPYKAGIVFNNSRIHIGCFCDKIQAALAYDQMARYLERDNLEKYYVLNFPDRSENIVDVMKIYKRNEHRWL